MLCPGTSYIKACIHKWVPKVSSFYLFLRQLLIFRCFFGGSLLSWTTPSGLYVLVICCRASNVWQIKTHGKLLFEVFSPYKVIVAKLGFSKGFSCHFHCIPATNEFMKEIANHSGYTSEPDGNDALLYASREYCERELTIEEKMAMEKTVSQLRTYS